MKLSTALKAILHQGKAQGCHIFVSNIGTEQRSKGSARPTRACRDLFSLIYGEQQALGREMSSAMRR